MEEYVYILVKLGLRTGQTEESIQTIVSELDYDFVHPDVLETEIREIYDYQVSDDDFDDTE